MNSAPFAPGRPLTTHRGLPAGPSAARHARLTAQRLLAACGGLCPDAVAADILLIVSELATNACLHAAPPYALTVGVDEGYACVAVSDASDRLPGRTGRPEGLPSHGRGLEIVRGLGADLYVSRSDHGKQVIAVLTWPP
ncbi:MULTISPECIES: ATP-binding protein [unclassified Streptomyces]|uniref:ATP-binding protein n=1 Tax=unclassified Streptomyces TaxID=2593676 RepID=UPI0036F647CD